MAGPTAHAAALDVDATGALRDIHRRVGTAILFESSGGQIDKVASSFAPNLEDDLRKILADLGLSDRVHIVIRAPENPI